MTANEFARECEAVFVSPSVALENDALAAALKARDDAEVRRLLREEF